MVEPRSDANQLIEDQLNEHLQSLEEILESDVLSYTGPIVDGIEINFRNTIEELRGNRKTKSPFLVVILNTLGGYITVAQRIADILRKHFRRIDYIIPDTAMSAGTVLAMSGDAIHMDYFSVLGPIDPQIERDGNLVSALGYLEKFNEFIEKDKQGGLSTAEMAYFVKKFDPATLSFIEHQKELSISLLQEWLVKYKFRNWKRTQTRRKPVTKAMKVARAKEIAEKLNDTSIWHSHGRGIPMEVLRRRLNLRIEDFGENASLNDQLRKYSNLLEDYMVKLQSRAVLHVQGNYQPVM